MSRRLPHPGRRTSEWSPITTKLTVASCHPLPAKACAGELTSLVRSGPMMAFFGVPDLDELAGLCGTRLRRADEIGASWQGHYDRLHLHTVRWLSSLPGLRLPRREGRWVPRDGVVRYLKAYVPTPPPARSAIHCRHVGAARRAGLASRDRRRAGSSGHGDRGYRRQPGAGAARLAWHVRLHRELVHSSAYRTGSAYAGEDVLVVGPGNCGAEIDTNRRIARRRTHDGHGAG